MPRGDSTGARGQGPRTGKSMGTSGTRMGRMSGTRAGMVPGGQCVCPSCGTTAVHKISGPCYQMKCPRCGTSMARE